jgi:hypothetical protein
MVHHAGIAHRAGLVLAAGLAAALGGCGSNSVTPGGGPAVTRTYRVGFSGFPPSPDFALAVASIEMWILRADGAIFHISPPWDSLLAGVPPDSLIRHDQFPLAQYFHARGLDVVVTLDPTDGLNRAAEAPQLVAAGRSLAEPAVQQLYRRYAVAIDTLLEPSRLGLAAETNLVRAAAPPALYAAVKQVANDAAADVRARDPAVREYVSVQVEAAWGRLGGGPASYVGVAQDVADFAFAQDFGLSSYPYLAGFAEPEDVPLDYYSRVRDQVGRNVLVVEGGWASTSVGPVVSSPAKQARWIRREATLLDQARAVGWYQLAFTDLALSQFPPQPPGSILPLFATLGLVDSALTPKPALAPWDSVYARRRR